jgi:hypothetical protein
MKNELVPANINELQVMSEHLATSDFVPVSMQGKPQDVFSCIAFGMEIGLKPMQSLQNIAVINNRPSIYGDAMIALVMGSNVFGSIKETFDDKTMTATCTASRKDGTENTQIFGKDDALAAGLWNRKGPWTQYPKRMLKFRARGFCLRDTFPDILSGIISTEEAQDYPQEKVVTVEEEIDIDDIIANCESMDELVNAWSSLSQDDKVKYAELKDTKKEELMK